jgi:NTE family protein
MLPVLLDKLLSMLWRRRSAGGPPPPGRAHSNRKSINLALQGGAAYGAFTWGVLDQILADGRLTIDGVSGGSAGAVNAVMLADGLARGGEEEARRRLAEFWRAASFGGQLPSPLPEAQRNVVERLFSFVPRMAAAPMPWVGALSRFLSPYDLNPLNINPLKDLIERFVDFDAIRNGDRELFIGATAVRTGEPRIFTREEVTAEAVMASACLPLLFRAVEIDGELYWDGGYSSNPPLVPFTHATATEDVLIVQINPRLREGAPTGAAAIMTRVQEITFNAALLAELRALALARSLIDEQRLPRDGKGEFRRLRLHRIVMDMAAFDAGGKLNTDFEFFELLHKLGQRAARRFLDAHYDDIGRRSTIDLRMEEPAEVA